jgi:hypothetical protein
MKADDPRANCSADEPAIAPARVLRIGTVVAVAKSDSARVGFAMHTEKPSPPPENPVDKSAEKKRAIRALKRILIAKAEVRRIRALTHAKLAGSRR